MKIRLHDSFLTCRLRYAPHVLSLFFAYIGFFYVITFSDQPSRLAIAILIAVPLFWVLWKAKKRDEKYRMVYLEVGGVSVGEFGKTKFYGFEEIDRVECDPKRLYQEATIYMKEKPSVTFIPRSLEPWGFEIKEPDLIIELKRKIRSNQSCHTTPASAPR